MAVDAFTAEATKMTCVKPPPTQGPDQKDQIELWFGSSIV